MSTQDAYLNLLQAVQDYVQAQHGDNAYARDWILLTGIEALQGAPDYSNVRMDTSPNSSNWAQYGLLTLAIENFQTNPEEDDD